MGLDNVIRNMEKWLKWIKYTHTIVSQIKKNGINRFQFTVFSLYGFHKYNVHYHGLKPN